MKKYRRVDLSTSDEPLEKIPLNEYPRPQLRRDSFLCLNGTWDLAITKAKEKGVNYNKKIIVPFCVESSLSNVKERVNKDDTLFCKREFSLPEGFNKGRIILHLDSINTYAVVYINEVMVCEHQGGYIPFEVDITDNLQEKNVIEIIVKNPLDHLEPYGKQKRDNGGMWYTPVSGIWKSVWLESVPSKYIKSIKIDTTLDTMSLKLDTNAKKKKFVIHLDNNKDIVRETTQNELTLTIPHPINWTPENPYLYSFDIYADEDKISSYFALRTLSIKEYNDKKVFHLNDKPYFFHGLLDQGYFPDGIYTPRRYKEYERDILSMKELGFNMLRKHIKVEPMIFYYLCDKLGMAVFQDMVNNGSYKFIRDTALPTIGLQKRDDTKYRVSNKVKEAFRNSMKETVSLLYNVPSICLWTIFNEGWGQFDSSKVYQELLSLDNSRFIDATSGWFDNGNPINSKHIYFKKEMIIPYDKRPIYLSEFGGYEYTIEGHRYNLDKIYGYKHFTNKEDFQKGITDLYLNQIVPLFKNGLSASVYTQVSDVEDETNGLLTYDRKVLKVDKEEMQNIAKHFKY